LTAYGLSIVKSKQALLQFCF